MTRATNARLAGATYLLYIAAAFPGMVLFDRARVAGIAGHATDVRISILLSVLGCFAAPVLAVALYAVTRDEDEDLALLAMVCRVGEGVIATIPTLATVGVLWLATTPDAAPLTAFLFRLRDWGTNLAATFFAVGSTLFCWLLLRSRAIPVPLAWLGVLASVLVAVVLPLELAGLLRGQVTQIVWLPMLVFELTLGPWLLLKGVSSRAVMSA
jgi:hypothetical protein